MFWFICSIQLISGTIELQQNEKLPLTPQNVFVVIKDLNIKYPEFVFAQAILESGEFKSKITKSNNNLFGMRRSKTRKSTSIGINKGYATYDCWYNSVVDYKLWQDKNPPSNNIDYSVYLKKRKYCTNPYYAKHIQMVLNQVKYKNIINS